MSSRVVLLSRRSTGWVILEALSCSWWRRSVCDSCLRRLFSNRPLIFSTRRRWRRCSFPSVSAVAPEPCTSTSIRGLAKRAREDKDRIKTGTETVETEMADQSFEKENIWTIPNILSLSRILLSPVLAHQVLQSNYLVAFGLLTVAAISDVVDGQIARYYPSQSSMLGSVLDPLADKCLVSILCISLTVQNLIPLPLTVIILSRDVLLIIVSLYMRYKTLPSPRTWTRYWDIQRSTLQVTPSLLSKANTLLQLSTVGLSLGAALINASHHPLLQTLWAITAVSTVTSGASYLIQMKGFRVLKKKRRRSTPSS